jgi:hypothetical protein
MNLDLQGHFTKPPLWNTSGFMLYELPEWPAWPEMRNG